MIGLVVRPVGEGVLVAGGHHVAVLVLLDKGVSLSNPEDLDVGTIKYLNNNNLGITKYLT